MQDATPNSSAPATETLDGFQFARWVIDVHQKNGDPVTELLKAAKWRETDWLEKKAAIYPSAEHDRNYRELLKETPKDELKTAKELYLNEIHKEIVAAVIALRHSRGGVVLIGVDDANHPVPLWEKTVEQSPQERGRKLDSFGRTEVLEKVFGKSKFECREEIWWLPSCSDFIQIQELKFLDRPVLALLVPPLPPESTAFLVAEVAELQDGENRKTKNRKKKVLRRMPGDAVGQTKRKTVEDDWFENEAKLGDFIRKRKELFFDNGDLAFLKERLLRVGNSVDAPRADHFVGRGKELSSLHAFLCEGKIPIVTGPGGTGKSELIFQYATKHESYYTGGLYQVDMEGISDWSTALLSILKRTKANCLGDDKIAEKLQKADSSTSKRRVILNALECLSADYGPVLLVMDNVEPAACKSLFDPCGLELLSLPQELRIVVSARSSDRDFPQNHRCVDCHLPELAPEAALDLLLWGHPAHSENERIAAGTVAKLLGFRSLYLRAIPALLDDDDSEFEGSWILLADALERDPLIVVDSGMECDERNRTPARLWSYIQSNFLRNERYGSDWVRLAQAAAIFSPDGFRRRVLEILWNGLSTADNRSEAASRQAFKRLRKYNLLEEQGDRVRMHRLTRRAILDSTREQYPDFETDVGKILAASPDVIDKDWTDAAGSFSVLRQIPPKMLTGSLCAELLLRNESFSAICPWDKLDGSDWLNLLKEKPQFADKCAWDKLNGTHWSWLIADQPQFVKNVVWEKMDGLSLLTMFDKQPQLLAHCQWNKLPSYAWPELLATEKTRFVEKCPWEKLTGNGWSWLLAEHPQFAEKCFWEKLDKNDWQQLLSFQPQFSVKCKWDLLNGGNWCWLLIQQPQFADQCYWNELDGRDWSDLLEKKPEFSEKCAWDKLDGGNWSSLLAKQPQFSDKCSWQKLNGSAWASLLSVQPQFATKCPWKQLDATDWAILLEKQSQFFEHCPLEDHLNDPTWMPILVFFPQFADKIPWKSLSGADWTTLLKDQPDLATRCLWDRLDGANWAELLKEQPQFADKCRWEKLKGNDWSNLLQKQPQFVDNVPWDGLNGEDWHSLLRSMPQFADRCSWGKLDGDHWAWLLNAQPQFADKCDWDKLNGFNWQWLLSDQPQFADKCRWDRLDGNNWAFLLVRQPQFKHRCCWDKLDSTNWRYLLEDHPQFAEKCPWRKLEGKDWAWLLRRNARLADFVSWENLRGSDWVEMLEELPHLSDQCDWRQLNGSDWSRLLFWHPEFADKCDWEKLGGRDWGSLLHNQPQFAEKCPWDKLESTDWKWLILFRPQFFRKLNDLAATGQVRFQLALADVLDDDGLRYRDPETAAKWYLRVAEQGDSEAQRHLGDMYASGRGVEQSDGEAIIWYRKAAEQGDVHSQRRLGEMIESGRGVAQSEEDAVSWYRKAAEQGDVWAQNKLGLMFEEGRGVVQSAEEAVSWYQKAAEGGYDRAQCNLGVMYATGCGVDEDVEKASRWFRIAADQGDARAQYYLGLMSEFGDGVEQSDNEAVAWYQKAAGQGYSDAQYRLGTMCETGRGVHRSHEDAVALYREAAEQGHEQAQINLGRMYMAGLGVEKCDEKAVEWFRKAAEEGSRVGFALWGHCLRFGIGIVQDEQQANACFDKVNDIDEAFNALAWVLWSAGQANQALPYAEKAAENVRSGKADNKTIEVFDTLAAVLDALGRADETKKVCFEILSLFPADDDSDHREENLIRLGRACHRLGDKAGAADAWSKALVLVEKHGGKHAEYGESADELRRLIRESGASDA